MSSTRKIWLGTFALAILPLMGFWLYGLFDLDEGFYAAVVSEMNRRGEWITPYYNGHPWYEKPIFLYWLAKPSVMLFGEAVGPRLPVVLSTVGVYVLVAWWVRRRFGELAAQYSVLVLASSLLFVGLGRMMMTDMPLTLAFTAALLFFWESLRESSRWRWWAGLMLGIGVLAKGPVAVLLFVPIASYVFWRERNLRADFRGGWMMGTALFLFAVAVWYVPAYLEGHRLGKVLGYDYNLFVQRFLIEQNLERFTGGDPAHTLRGFESFLFFIPVLLIGMAPWSFFIPKAWPRKTDADQIAPENRFLAAWAAVVFLFFTVSGAKLPHYILPCIPPLAILVGIHLAHRRGAADEGQAPIPVSQFRWAGPAMFGLAVLLTLGLRTWWQVSGHAEVQGMATWLRRQGAQNVAAYQMPRREEGLGTGKLKIQETSHPSLEFYLDQKVRQLETLEELAEWKPRWIITRAGRISTNDAKSLQAAGLELLEVKGSSSEHYALYSLRESNR